MTVTEYLEKLKTLTTEELEAYLLEVEGKIRSDRFSENIEDLVGTRIYISGELERRKKK